MSGVSFSGLLDSAKKVFEAPFKATEKVVSMSTAATEHSLQEIKSNPILRTIAIAAVIYFTAGIAMSAFPATAGYAAAMPGVTSASGAMGVSAATADTAAAAAGAGSVGAGGAVAADAGTTVAAGAGADVGGAAAAGAGGGSVAVPGSFSIGAADAGGTGVAAAAPAAAGGGSAVAGTGMTGLEKIAGAKVASDAIGGALAPSAQQEAAAQKKFQGAFFGQGQSEGGTNTAIVPPGGFDLLPGGHAPGAPNPGARPGNNAATAAPDVSGAAPSLADVMQQTGQLPQPAGFDLIGPGG